MKNLIVYYSRTGTTKKAAEILAKNLNADFEEIVDKKDRSGIWGYIKSCIDAIRRQLTEIVQLKKDTKKYDTIIIGTPLWVGTIPPAIRTYLKNNTFENKKIGVLITHGGSDTEKVLNEIKKLIPKANQIGKLAIKQKEMWDAENKIKEWVKNLKP